MTDAETEAQTLRDDAAALLIGRDASAAADVVTWAPVFFGDKVHRFQLGYDQMIELEQKAGAGCYVLLHRVKAGMCGVVEIAETLRLGLIGGGGLTPAEADQLVGRYCRARPLAESRPVAHVVLVAALAGLAREAAEAALAPSTASDGAAGAAAGPSS